MQEKFFYSNVPMSPGNKIYLNRPQIDSLMEKAIQKPVLIVCAGAGYGKTQAVYSFVRKYPALTGWMQISERDNIGERFWENFTAGISGGNKKAAERLSVINFPETEREFERYLIIPREETKAGKKYIIVYDDFHLLHDKAVLRFLERSINAPFSNITSILISRTEPAIDLEQLISKGLVGRITEDNLRFSRKEIAEYFRIQNINLSSKTISSIYNDTEGWAFAIHLAGLSLKNADSGAVYANLALRSNIFKLIASEIMTPLPLPVQRFLIKLSLIEHLTPDLLEELTEDPSIIKQMKKMDSFIRFDTYHNAYHIHHLFLDYLKCRQDELTADEKKELWRKTALWCAANNKKVDALSYYEKAENYERLIGVVEAMPPILPNRTARMLLEIMERAPEKIYDQIATAQIIRTGLYLTLEMFDKSREELAKVIGRLEARPPSPAVYRTLTGCYNNLGFIGMITSSYTRDYDYIHYFEKARKCYEFNKFETLPPITMMPLSSYLCRVTCEEQGEMERYIDAISKVVPYVSVTFGGSALGMDELCRGELSFFRGKMAEAEQFVLSALENARRGNQYDTENRALFYLLRIYLAQGNYEAVQDTIKHMDSQLNEQYYLTRFTNYDIVTGWYYTHIGQTDRLALWLKDDFEESDFNSIVYGLEILVKAKYHFAEKRYSAVLSVLKTWETRSSRWSFLLGKIEGKALEAVCRYQLKNKEDAFAALEQACRLAQSNAITMPFTELGKNMRALAEAALKAGTTTMPRNWLEKVRRSAASYAKKLFAAAEQYRPAISHKKKLDSGANLSPREMEVLTGLSQGMTREEIASAFSLSVNTVKSVIRSIYNKLGALNKADAVRIAAAKGIT
ncbi:MAG: LuxR C-terminal-related transcriptional regulator [Treponema sp.]|jgi:LuxR family maltose regulon positive regulatory protein|nr:LuxR C-terminal-related transcriptional regulator [Treponema sp.]